MVFGICNSIHFRYCFQTLFLYIILLYTAISWGYNLAYISRRAFPLWENLRYLLFLRTVRSKFPFQNCIMKRGDNVPVREMLLLIVAGGGLLMDLLQEKVDNRLICLGFGFGFILALMSHSISGILNFFFGILFPLFSLLPLFYFHMIGGGDIKLLSAKFPA